MPSRSTSLLLALLVSFILSSGIMFVLLTRNLSYPGGQVPGTEATLMNQINTGVFTTHIIYPLEIAVLFFVLFLVGFCLLFYVLFNKIQPLKK